MSVGEELLEILLEHARILHADDLAMLTRRVDAAIDPERTPKRNTSWDPSGP